MSDAMLTETELDQLIGKPRHTHPCLPMSDAPKDKRILIQHKVYGESVGMFDAYISGHWDSYSEAWVDDCGYHIGAPVGFWQLPLPEVSDE